MGALSRSDTRILRERMTIVQRGRQSLWDCINNRLPDALEGNLADLVLIPSIHGNDKYDERRACRRSGDDGANDGTGLEKRANPRLRTRRKEQG
jgi:hypothetical protein